MRASARHDDEPRRIVAGRGVSRDFASIEFVLDTGVSRRPGKERLTECHAAIGVGAYLLFLSWYSARRWRYSFTTASAFFCRPSAIAATTRRQNDNLVPSLPAAIGPVQSD